MACLFALACAISGYVFAEETKIDAAVEDFFKASKIREKYELGLTSGFDAGSELKKDVSDEQKKKFESFRKKIKAMMLDEMGWEKVKGEYAKLYLSIYTPEELKKVTEMLKTPAGQIMVSKEIELLPKALKLGNEKAKLLMPKIMKMAREEMSE